MTKNELLSLMKGEIIVSCQAVPGEPLYDPDRSLMPYMALAAQRAGARMIRTSSVRDIIGIREATGLPVIGLIKRSYEGYEGYITLTMHEVDECVQAGADIVSIDCTDGKRGDGRTAPEFLREIRKKYPDLVIMADCAAFGEGIAAVRAGADMVGSTLSGYTRTTADQAGAGPDFELVRRWVNALPCPVIAEGRVHTPEQARKMLELGAWAVVVGGAITRPLEIAERFFQAIRG